MQYCFSPKYVCKPGTNKVISVPCGHCAGCLNHRAQEWQNRIEVELSQHRYNFFVTLTYDNDNVPVFHPDSDVYDWYMTDFQRSNLLEYLQKKEEISDYYLVLKYVDIQNFIKRLRNYVCSSKIGRSWTKMLRYFCCGEYGPTTKRPHYHLLFFLDDEWLCEERDGKSLFAEYVRKAWQNYDSVSSERTDKGRIDVQRVFGSAGRYVSGYVTSFANLPSLLRQAPFHPFCVASKSPSLGSFRFDASQAEEVFRDGKDYLYNGDGSADKKNVDLYLWKSLKDTLFPKCYGFSNLSFEDRFVLYGIGRFPYRGSSFFEFKQYVFERKDTYFVQKLAEIFDDEKCIESFLHGLDGDDSPIQRRVLRQWRQSCSILTNCSIFNISLGEYAVKIADYYCNHDYRNLVSQLRKEEELSSSYDSRYLLGFVDKSLYRNDGKFTFEDYQLLMESFGFSDGDDPIHFDWFSLPEVKSFYDKIQYQVDVGKSYKAMSDYVLHGDLSNLNIV